jgi:putative toxin-antitoxin system antitoxin component (TIGR02293 family)
VKTCPSLEKYIGISPPSGLELAQLVEKGLPTRNLDHLKACGLTTEEIASAVISMRTLKRREHCGKKLTRQESDRAIRVASILRLADCALGNLETALRWLRKKDRRLRGRTALNLLRTEPGGHLIESMLSLIAAGNIYCD